MIDVQFPVEETGIVLSEIGLDNLELSDKNICPICNTPLFVNGHCRLCMECGWSACEL